MHEGWLQKKNPGRIRSQWSRHYFVLTPHALAYYAQKEDDIPTGFLPIRDVTSVYLKDASSGVRFDVHATSRLDGDTSLYALRGTTVDQARRWVSSLKQAMGRFRVTIDLSKRRRSMNLSSDAIDSGLRVLQGVKNNTASSPRANSSKKRQNAGLRDTLSAASGAIKKIAARSTHHRKHLSLTAADHAKMNPGMSHGGPSIDTTSASSSEKPPIHAAIHDLLQSSLAASDAATQKKLAAFFDEFSEATDVLRFFLEAISVTTGWRATNDQIALVTRALSPRPPASSNARRRKGRLSVDEGDFAAARASNSSPAPSRSNRLMPPIGLSPDATSPKHVKHLVRRMSNILGAPVYLNGSAPPGALPATGEHNGAEGSPLSTQTVPVSMLLRPNNPHSLATGGAPPKRSALKHTPPPTTYAVNFDAPANPALSPRGDGPRSLDIHSRVKLSKANRGPSPPAASRLETRSVSPSAEKISDSGTQVLSKVPRKSPSSPDLAALSTSSNASADIDSSHENSQVGSDLPSLESLSPSSGTVSGSNTRPSSPSPPDVSSPAPPDNDNDTGGDELSSAQSAQSPKTKISITSSDDTDALKPGDDADSDKPNVESADASADKAPRLSSSSSLPSMEPSAESMEEIAKAAEAIAEDAGVTPPPPAPKPTSSKLPPSAASVCSIESCEAVKAPHGGMYCARHLTEHATRDGEMMAVLSALDEEKFFDLALRMNFFNALVDVFKLSDSLAHAITLHILWILMHRHDKHECRHTLLCPSCQATSEWFASIVRDHLSGKRFSPMVKEGLLAILQCETQMLPEIGKSSTSFSKFVSNAGVWRAVFIGLRESEFQVRLDTLEGVLAILIESLDNSETIYRQPGWQTWALPMLADLSEDFEDHPLQLKVWQYFLNIVTILHYSIYMKKSDVDFSATTCQTLTVLARFGRTNSTLRVGYALLAAIATKLLSNAKSFPVSYDSIVWSNLLRLGAVVRTWCFGNFSWGTFPTLPLDADSDHRHHHDSLGSVSIGRPHHDSLGSGVGVGGVSTLGRHHHLKSSSASQFSASGTRSASTSVISNLSTDGGVGMSSVASAVAHANLTPRHSRTPTPSHIPAISQTASLEPSPANSLSRASGSSVSHKITLKSVKQKVKDTAKMVGVSTGVSRKSRKEKKREKKERKEREKELNKLQQQDGSGIPPPLTKQSSYSALSTSSASSAGTSGRGGGGEDGGTSGGVSFLSVSGGGGTFPVRRSSVASDVDLDELLDSDKLPPALDESRVRADTISRVFAAQPDSDPHRCIQEPRPRPTLFPLTPLDSADEGSDAFVFDVSQSSYGLHFESSGKCRAGKLVHRMVSLLKRCHIDYDVGVLPQMQKEERSFLHKATELNGFFLDAKDFISLQEAHLSSASQEVSASPVPSSLSISPVVDLFKRTMRDNCHKFIDAKGSKGRKEVFNAIYNTSAQQTSVLPVTRLHTKHSHEGSRTLSKTSPQADDLTPSDRRGAVSARNKDSSSHLQKLIASIEKDLPPNYVATLAKLRHLDGEVRALVAELSKVKNERDEYKKVSETLKESLNIALKPPPPPTRRRSSHHPPHRDSNATAYSVDHHLNGVGVGGATAIVPSALALPPPSTAPPMYRTHTPSSRVMRVDSDFGSVFSDPAQDASHTRTTGDLNFDIEELMGRRDEIDAELRALDEEARAQDANTNARSRRATKRHSLAPGTADGATADAAASLPPASPAGTRSKSISLMPVQRKPTNSSSSRSRSASPNSRGGKKTGRWSKSPRASEDALSLELSVSKSKSKSSRQSLFEALTPTASALGDEGDMKQTFAEALSPQADVTNFNQTLFEALSPPAAAEKESVSAREEGSSASKPSHGEDEDEDKEDEERSAVARQSAMERADRAARLRLELSEIEVQLPKLQREYARLSDAEQISLKKLAALGDDLAADEPSRSRSRGSISHSMSHDVSERSQKGNVRVFLRVRRSGETPANDTGDGSEAVQSADSLSPKPINFSFVHHIPSSGPIDAEFSEVEAELECPLEGFEVDIVARGVTGSVREGGAHESLKAIDNNRDAVVRAAERVFGYFSDTAPSLSPRGRSRSRAAHADREESAVYLSESEMSIAGEKLPDRADSSKPKSKFLGHAIPSAFSFTRPRANSENSAIPTSSNTRIASPSNHSMKRVRSGSSSGTPPLSPAVGSQRAHKQSQSQSTRRKRRVFPGRSHTAGGVVRVPSESDSPLSSQTVKLPSISPRYGSSTSAQLGPLSSQTVKLPSLSPRYGSTSVQLSPLSPLSSQTVRVSPRTHHGTASATNSPRTRPAPGLSRSHSSATLTTPPMYHHNISPRSAHGDRSNASSSSSSGTRARSSSGARRLQTQRSCSSITDYSQTSSHKSSGGTRNSSDSLNVITSPQLVALSVDRVGRGRGRDRAVSIDSYASANEGENASGRSRPRTMSANSASSGRSTPSLLSSSSSHLDSVVPEIRLESPKATAAAINLSKDSGRGRTSIFGSLKRSIRRSLRPSSDPKPSEASAELYEMTRSRRSARTRVRVLDRSHSVPRGAGGVSLRTISSTPPPVPPPRPSPTPPPVPPRTAKLQRSAAKTLIVDS